MSTIKIKVGERLRAAREERGLTTEQMAGSLGATDATYSAWESGLHELPLAVFETLHAKFVITPNYLILGQKDGPVGKEVW